MGKKIALFAFCVLCITFTLIGCGGGGGGGTTGNPVGPVAVTGPLADLSGTVKLSTGEILANAPVEICRSELALQTGIPGLSALRGSVFAQTKLADGKYSTKTDTLGVYRFTGIPVGEYTLTANAGGASQFSRTVLLGSVTSIDAQLTPTGKASGKLLLVNGDPARGVVVHLAKTSYVAISDFNGEFVFDQIPSGQTFTLSVLPLQGVLQNPLTVSVAPAEDKQLGNLVLTVPTTPTQEVSTVSGSVIAADSSVPTSALGSKIVLVVAAGNTMIENMALTDASGKFSLNVKAAGNYNVSVVGGEFAVAPTVQTVTVSALGTTVTVPQAFVLAKPTVVFPPTTQFYTYSGTISKRSKAFSETDNAGVPLTLTSTDAAANVFSAVTSPTGSFTFSIPAGTYNLAVGGGYAFETAFPGNPATINAPTVLNTVIWVVPTQVFTANYLVEGSINKITRVNGETDNSNVIVTLTPTTGAAVTFAGSTTSSGNFAVRVPAGIYNFAITGAYRFETAFTNPVNASTGNVNISPVINVVPLAQNTFMLSGSINKLIKKAGEFNNGDVTVTIRSDSAIFKPQTTVTEANGNFAFKVPAGNYAVEVGSGYVFVSPPSGFPYAITTADLVLASPLDVRPSGVVPASIGGNVTPPRPNNPYRVRIENTDGTYTDNETTEGAFYFNNLTPGSYRIVVLPDANGYYVETASPIVITEGQHLAGISLAPTQVAPSITGVNLAESVLTISGSNFESLPVSITSTKILVDGNPRARPAVFTPADVQEQAMIVSVTPGKHNVIIEKQWTRPGTTETFVLKSAPYSFDKLMGSPSNVAATDITDTSARISWTNANFTSKSIVDVYSGGSLITSEVLDGTSFQVNGLLPSTNYTAQVKNRYGDVESTTPTSVTFTTRSSGLKAASSVALANSAFFLDLNSSNMAIFGFEMMNDKIYVAYASASNEVFVKSYSSVGAELNTWQIQAWFGAGTSRMSMCSGGNQIFVTYSDNPTTIQKLTVLGENLSQIGSTYSFDSIGSDIVDQIKIEYHGGRVYAAFTDYSTLNNVYLYAFNSDLTSPTPVYFAQNSFMQPTSGGYYIQTAADEMTGDLYVAVASATNAFNSIYDSFEVMRKPLANPTTATATIGFVRQVPSTG
ncbi:MAG TPA: carboxypeptidase regulatory-like domain-containing protein, partial [Candidatus Ozemobacteraceae bacterium]|nr:carboxypeptidase regulatory-like domain-containing protein [Candidatus Ozemobacteraceae bacterium]